MKKTLQLTSNFALQKYGKRDNDPEGSSSRSNKKRQRNTNENDCISLLPSKKKRKEIIGSEDGINQLTDDILVIILSHLTMKEAARTSVLSRRWRYLWTFFTGSLDFDESVLVTKLEWQIVRNPIDVERDRFVRWVNQVLKSHQAQSIYQLKICFSVDSKCDIDGWIDFAIKKKVQSLELDFTDRRRRYSDVHYAFPSHLLNFSNLSSLTALRLTSVNVTGGDVENLLSYCPNLEVLSVADTISLLSLKVSGPSLKLKSLELKYCYDLEYIEIFAVNLGSFVYFGKKTSIFLKNVPRLTEVSFEGFHTECVIDDLCQHSSYLSQLEKLKLNMTVLNIIEFEIPHSIPPLSGIKHLELTCRDCTVESLLRCASLLKAFPSLYEFTLKIAITSPLCEEILELTEEHAYEFLKVVKIVGFGGVTNDTEFVMYLVENSPLLEKLTIDLCAPNLAGGPLEYLYRDTARHQLARERAMELGAKLPPRIEFVVIYE